MRIILSQGKVNIFNLAKNAGTSVNHGEFLNCVLIKLALAEMKKDRRLPESSQSRLH
jgi:hypothetical protein